MTSIGLDSTVPLWGLLIFLVGLVWALITMYFDIRAMKNAIRAIKEAEVKADIARALQAEELKKIELTLNRLVTINEIILNRRFSIIDSIAHDPK